MAEEEQLIIDNFEKEAHLMMLIDWVLSYVYLCPRYGDIMPCLTKATRKVKKRANGWAKSKSCGI